jgi:hypothetical protein
MIKAYLLLIVRHGVLWHLFAQTAKDDPLWDYSTPVVPQMRHRALNHELAQGYEGSKISPSLRNELVDEPGTYCRVDALDSRQRALAVGPEVIMNTLGTKRNILSNKHGRNLEGRHLRQGNLIKDMDINLLKEIQTAL